MKKIFISACMLSLLLAHAHAQETYENTKMVDNDLNGTARYVGMGGAMEALGADISTISTNPAGIGLFRHSTASASFGMVLQDRVTEFGYGNKANASFDQAGVVYSYRSGKRQFYNFAVNYHKSKNFDYILTAVGGLHGASQNKMSFIKALGERDKNGYSTVNIESTTRGYQGTNYWTSQLDNLYYNTLMYSKDGFMYNDASSYMLGRANTGYIGQYDLNMSGNIDDRVYVGLTVGLHDVHYHGRSLYTESLLDADNKSAGNVTVSDDRRITGTGFNVGAGVILRPVEGSPFRIGVSVTTPTWYDLTTRNYTYLINNTKYSGAYPQYVSNEAYSFKLFTPWKFGISLGHTIGRSLALGASYEYADYSTMDTRVKDGEYVDEWGGVYDNSYSDREMKHHTEMTLKGVSTLKLGAEYKPVRNVAVRVGYNYVSPMYRSNGFKDGSLDSYGSNYSSATDYTNWKSTNRFTLGLGYTTGRFAFDLAYQYSQTNGDFHPFADSYTDMYVEGNDNKVDTLPVDNYAEANKVENRRNQLLFSISCSF